jgi:hypothetical protein
MAAMAVVSTAIGIAGSMAAASAQRSAFEANQNAAIKATVNSYAGTGLRQQQERNKAAAEQFDVGMQMQQAKSSATASAGETGTAEGVSFDILLRDYEARGGRAVATSQDNADMAVGALQNEKEAAQTRGVAAINSVPKPSPMALFADVGAKLAAGGLKIYDVTQRGRT